MFAARANQENAIYEQQQAAAAKPLNQGIKGLAPKTPSNKQPKTPFGKARNDENATVAVGKAEGKATTRNAFVTPANPRARAPLGNKTTNAKAFQTPAALLGPGKKEGSEHASTNKATSPRMQRSKLKIHQPSAAKLQHDLPADPEEREIEYMPPREVPLPDTYEDHWPHECEFVKLRGQDLTRGHWSEFAPRKNEDDDDLSDYDEAIRQADERNKKETAVKQARENKCGKAVSLKPGLSSIAAKEAASALNSQPTKTKAFRSASSTTGSTVRKPTTASIAARKPIFDRGNPRFTAAKAASNSTIGYSKGRTVKSTRAPLSEVQFQDSRPTESTEQRTALDDLLDLESLRINSEDADRDVSSSNNSLGLLMEDDDEPEVFQLDEVQES